ASARRAVARSAEAAGRAAAAGRWAAPPGAPAADAAVVRSDVRMPSVYDRFNLVSDFQLAGDQQRAIGELVEALDRGDKHQVLLGVTGSGKTFTMAQTLAR